MARPLRIEYDGAVYHITARGNEKRPIYRSEKDYVGFLDILEMLPTKFDVIVHGYALMRNHYHLLLETPRANLGKAMHYLNATYTGFFNRRHNRAGHLFQGRYKGLLIEKDRYLLSVSRYIHLNPVRAGMAEKPEQYKWSSHPAYIGRRQRPEWLTCDWILRQYSKGEAEARRRYRAFVEEGMRAGENPFEDLREGLLLGSDEFIEHMRNKIKGHREIPASRSLKVTLSCDEVLAAVSERLGVPEAKILESGKRDNVARKVCLYLLNRHTDMGNEQVANRFGVGYTAVSQAASRVAKEMKKDRGLSKLIASLERALLSEE